MYSSTLSSYAFGHLSRQKDFAMALYGVAAMFAPLAGPFFGGYLTDNWSWQWVFIINIPLCLISIALIKFLIPKDEPVKEKYNKNLISLDLLELQ